MDGIILFFRAYRISINPLPMFPKKKCTYELSNVRVFELPYALSIPTTHRLRCPLYLLQNNVFQNVYETRRNIAFLIMTAQTFYSRDPIHFIHFLPRTLLPFLMKQNVGIRTKCRVNHISGIYACTVNIRL